MAKKKLDSLKFGEAREKLEAILNEIEQNEVDVDDLAERVRTAAELIRICKSKLDRTKMEVEKVVAELVPKESAQDRVEEEPGGDGGADADAPF